MPFCIDGGAAAAAGIGEKLTPVESHLPLWLVITKPKAGCSTPAMYRRIDEMGESLRQRFTTQEAAKALEKGDLAGLCGSLYNVFEEVTALPDLSEIRQELRQSGALAAMMTGSGSAVFGIFPEEDAAKVAAEKMAESRWAILLSGNRKAGVSGKRRRAPAASEGRTACGTQAAGPRQSGGRPPQEGREKRW